MSMPSGTWSSSLRTVLFKVNMKQTLWKTIAWLVSREPVANWIIRRAQRTPYSHLPGYMTRWHLFNAPDANKVRPIKWLPWIRVHHILRPDRAKHQHSHPWAARTIILRGYYRERRGNRMHFRPVGDTAALATDVFHHIEVVSPGGAYTLFICGSNTGGSWGFKTGSGVVNWRTYLGEK